MVLTMCYTNKRNSNTGPSSNTLQNNETCKQKYETQKLKTSTLLMKSFYTRHEEYMQQKVLHISIVCMASRQDRCKCTDVLGYVLRKHVWGAFNYSVN